MLTKQQQKVKDNIMDILTTSGLSFKMRSLSTSNSFTSTVGGYAGTGKTYLITEIRNEIKKQFPKMNVAFCTFTGKAASVLSDKLEGNMALGEYDYVGTIHKLIYKPKTKYEQKLKAYVIIGWELKDFYEVEYDLIITDESSMISKNLWDDLRSFDIPIISFGDHGQLGPVSDVSFNLMKKPDHILTEIHRQAEKSPIIQLSKIVRTTGMIPTNTIFSKKPAVLKVQWNSSVCQNIWNKLDFGKDMMVLCGFNMTRNFINRIIRKSKGYNGVSPYPGERIVCLKNNNELGIMNGQTGNILFLMPEKYSNTYRLTVQMDNSELLCEAFTNGETFDQVTYTIYTDVELCKKLERYSFKNKLGGVNYFDYGYCISVHKSQGSEWDKIVLFEQRNKYQNDREFARWLYTGITRAREKLLIITDFNS